MKLTPARFIAQYNALGVRFELRNGVVVPVGRGVSPLLVEAVAQRSEWLKPWLGEQASQGNCEPSSVQGAKSSTQADALIWRSIEGGRRAEERKAGTINRVKAKRWKVKASSGDADEAMIRPIEAGKP